MDIAERLKKFIDERPEKLTYRSVSLDAGLSDSMVHKYVTRQTRTMSLENLERIARVISVDPRWLIFGDTAATPNDETAVLLDSIPPNRRAQALAILKTFAESEEGAGPVIADNPQTASAAADQDAGPSFVKRSYKRADAREAAEKARADGNRKQA